MCIVSRGVHGRGWGGWGEDTCRAMLRANRQGQQRRGGEDGSLQRVPSFFGKKNGKKEKTRVGLRESSSRAANGENGRGGKT